MNGHMDYVHALMIAEVVCTSYFALTVLLDLFQINWITMDVFYHAWFSEVPTAVIVWTLERELDKDTLYKEVTVKIVWLLAVVFGVICAN